MAEKFSYSIGGRKFIQKPLTLGQWQQLIDLLGQGIKVPPELNSAGVMMLLSQMGLLGEALAVVLEPRRGAITKFIFLFLPARVIRKNKNTKKLAAFIGKEIDGPTTLEVVEDFFDLTKPIFDRVTAIAAKAKGAAAGLSNASSPSPAGISPGETKSSGATPLENAGPG